MLSAPCPCPCPCPCTSPTSTAANFSSFSFLSDFAFSVLSFDDVSFIPSFDFSNIDAAAPVSTTTFPDSGNLTGASADFFFNVIPADGTNLSNFSKSLSLYPFRDDASLATPAISILLLLFALVLLADDDDSPFDPKSFEIFVSEPKSPKLPKLPKSPINFNSEPFVGLYEAFPLPSPLPSASPSSRIICEATICAISVSLRFIFS